MQLRLFSVKSMWITVVYIVVLAGWEIFKDYLASSWAKISFKYTTQRLHLMLKCSFPKNKYFLKVARKKRMVY